MTKSLTNDELAICAATGTPVDTYIAARAPKLARTVPIYATERERQIAHHRAGAPEASVFTHGVGAVFENLVMYQRTHSPGNLRAAQARLESATAIMAARHLTPHELAICTAMGTSPARFALEKLAAVPFNVRAKREAETIFPQDLDAAGWAARAIEDIQRFLKDPNHIESLQFILSALGAVKNAVTQAGADHRAASGGLAVNHAVMRTR